MGGTFTVRMTLPTDWYEMGRDSPETWLATIIPQLLPSAGTDVQDVLGDDLIDEYGLLHFRQPTDLLVHVPPPAERVHATLLTYPWTAHKLMRRDVGSYADTVVKALQRAGAKAVDRRDVTRPSGPGVRLHATAEDELGRRVEQVLNVVLPSGAGGAVILRMQWAPGTADAADLVAMVDRIAGDALVEAFA